jgi:hypothetical protein
LRREECLQKQSGEIEIDCKMNTDEFTPEPVKKWTRKNYDMKKLDGCSERERAEIETTRDLSKPIEQLVCDFHDKAEEVIDPNSSKAADVNWCLIQAQKRMVSLMGRVALEHQKSTKQLICLNKLIVILTIAIVGLTVAVLLKSKIN